MFEFHVSRQSRDKYQFDELMFYFNGNVIFTDFLAARRFAQNINQKRDTVNFPEKAVKAGDINAIGLIDEIFHLIVSLYRRHEVPDVMERALAFLNDQFEDEKIDNLLKGFTNEFPPVSIYQGKITVEKYLQSSTNGIPNKHIVLEELLMLWLTNKNTAVSSFSEIFDDSNLQQSTIYPQALDAMRVFFNQMPHFGPDNQDLVTMLRAPAVEEPDSLIRQLEFIKRKWASLIGDYLNRLLNSIDLINEEEKVNFAGPGATQIPGYIDEGSEENFSQDSDWMPQTVMLAKNSYVWLYQLSNDYNREIRHLDQIPDQELERLANWGFNGLWLIGLWERSDASKKIKQLCGNPEAVASAYSIKNYTISEDLGGEDAYQHLREKAWQKGIRLASDMVPNHMGIDSDWVLNHPEWFLSLPHSPFPAYSFTGPDLSPISNVGLYIEDHYFERSDAAVVFKRLNRENGEVLYIYHGNDGTSMPWNDTAQLNYLQAGVREAVIQTILHVAKKFPIIRFDAAMTLAKKHYKRLWFPRPGTGGAIPSRAEHGLTKESFDAAFPKEFWRDVVDRVAEEAPDTLLLAEAFWMMEGYFVRTLGMHRVYNSAFMNMLRNEENSKYRSLIKNTLEFDPQILKRYVNFMNNPDEETASEQFGTGDKYFGICTLMVTMPGLPMFGHGQIQGFKEKYGMEYFRPYSDEKPDQHLIERHQREIFPLLRQRQLFSDIQNFFLYDFYTADSQVDEDVFAYSNGNDSKRALVIYNNQYGHTKGRIHKAAKTFDKTTNTMVHNTLYSGLNLQNETGGFVIFRDSITGLEYIRSCEEIKHKGLQFNLDAYQFHVFVDFRRIEDTKDEQYRRLNAYLQGRGVPNIIEALKQFTLAPVFNPIQELINVDRLEAILQARVSKIDEMISQRVINDHLEKYLHFMTAVKGFTDGRTDISPVIKEHQRGLEAILKLRVFDKRYPFPGSKRYLTAVKYIQNYLEEDQLAWYILLLWNDLRLLGKVITDEPQYSEISQGWLDEWGIMNIVQHSLIELGFDAHLAAKGATLLKVLVGQQNWLMSLSEEPPASFIEAWLSEEEICNYLNINRDNDTLWYDPGRFDSFLWWMMTISAIQSVADPEKSISEAVENIFEAYEIIETILKAGIVSESQVEKLLEGLK